jgi:hypothetical protein
MAREVDISMDLGSANTGLVVAGTLRAQLVDSDGSTNGSAISAGFIEIGNGQYLWNYADVPDTFRGLVSFYLSTSVYTDPLAITSLVAVVDTLEAADITGGAGADAIADAVWDEVRSGHTTSGTFGGGVLAESLNTQAKTDVGDAVWDEASSGHVTSGTFGDEVLVTADKTEIISSGDSNKDDIIAVIPSASDNADAVRTELAVELARIDKPISECCPDQGDIEITQGDSSPDRSLTAG